MSAATTEGAHGAPSARRGAVGGSLFSLRGSALTHDPTSSTAIGQGGAATGGGRCDTHVGEVVGGDDAPYAQRKAGVVGGSCSSSHRGPAPTHDLTSSRAIGQGGAAPGVGRCDTHIVGEVVGDHAPYAQRKAGVVGGSPAPTHTAGSSRGGGAGGGGLRDILIVVDSYAEVSLCVQRTALSAGFPSRFPAAIHANLAEATNMLPRSADRILLARSSSSSHIESFLKTLETIFERAKFYKKPPGSPKGPRLQNKVRVVQAPIPKVLSIISFGVLIEKIGSYLLNIKHKISKFLQSALSISGWHLAMWVMGAFAAIYQSYGCFHNYKHRSRNTVQWTPGQKVILVSYDVFGYDKGRKMLRKVCQIDEFDVVIPLCVKDLLSKKMLECGPFSHMATASLLTIKDLESLGRITLQETEEPLGEDTAGDGGLRYEARMINYGLVLRRKNPQATLIVVSNSDSLRSRAARHNLSWCRPLDLLN